VPKPRRIGFAEASVGQDELGQGVGELLAGADLRAVNEFDEAVFDPAGLVVRQ
jgi:hypothetical protein